NVALFHGRLSTRYGWQTHTKPAAGSDDPNVRSLANFPCQANAADVLRLAAPSIVDAGVKLDATVHAAVLIESDARDIEAAVSATREAMDRASELVLYGFRLRTEPVVIRWPDRYRDDRGAAFFDEMMRRLGERLRGPCREVVPLR